LAWRRVAGAETSLRLPFLTPGNLCGVRGGAAETGLRRVDSEARADEGRRTGGDAAGAGGWGDYYQ
jgi:hypothetical protein